jgi:hypothetical protein
MWRRPVALAVGVLHLCTACYSYVPVRSAPAPGAQVALEVTDEGRVALNEKIGPGVVRLEGTLAAVEGRDLLVDASAVQQIRGGYISELGGMRVRLSPNHVTRIDQRQFSRRRTFMVVGGVVATIAAFFIAKGISGRGTPPEDSDGGGGPDQ